MKKALWLLMLPLCAALLTIAMVCALKPAAVFAGSGVVKVNGSEITAENAGDVFGLGNREIKSNVRILIVNNGLGQEFKNYSCFSSMFGDDTNKFIAAQGHYGNKSSVLVKNYAEALGFEYLTASNKDEFLQTAERFVVPQMTDKPIIFEVFTKTEDESKALELVTLISNESKLKRKADDVILNPALKPVREVLKKVLKK